MYENHVKQIIPAEGWWAKCTIQEEDEDDGDTHINNKIIYIKICCMALLEDGSVEHMISSETGTINIVGCDFSFFRILYLGNLIPPDHGNCD